VRSMISSPTSRPSRKSPCVYFHLCFSELMILRNQKDRTTAYLTLLNSLLSPPPISSASLIVFGRHFTISTNVATVVGRRVLGIFVIALCSGSGFERTGSISTENDDLGDENKWIMMGRDAFEGNKGEEIRRDIVVGVLSGGNTGGWCDEQVSSSILSTSL